MALNSGAVFKGGGQLLGLAVIHIHPRHGALYCLRLAVGALGNIVAGNIEAAVFFHALKLLLQFIAHRFVEIRIGKFVILIRSSAEFFRKVLAIERTVCIEASHRDPDKLTAVSTALNHIAVVPFTANILVPLRNRRIIIALRVHIGGNNTIQCFDDQLAIVSFGNLEYDPFLSLKHKFVISMFHAFSSSSSFC